MTDEVLYVTEAETLVVPPDEVSSFMTTEAETELLETTVVQTELLEVNEQGPIGPPGLSAIPYGPSLNADASRPVAYVGYATRIMKLDYSTYPPTKTLAVTSNLAADWPNRATLSYT